MAFLIGFVGNGYLIWVIAKAKQLHNLTYGLVACLAISDCFKGLVFLLLGLAQFVYREIQKKSSAVISLVIYYGLSYSYLVSLLMIILLTLERYITCVHGTRKEQILTKEKVLVAITFGWITPLIYVIVMVLLEKDTKGNPCTKQKRVFTYCNSVVIILSFIVVTYIYIQLYQSSRRQLKKIRLQEESVRVQVDRARRLLQNLKIAAASSIVSLEFAVFIVPRSFLLFLLQSGHCGQSCQSALSINNTFLVLHPVVNMLVYSLSMRKLRKLLKRRLKNCLVEIMS